jgi:hypothetical protein
MKLCACVFCFLKCPKSFFLSISCEYTQCVLAKCLLGINFFLKIKILHHNALCQPWEQGVPEINIPLIPSKIMQGNALLQGHYPT